MATKYNYIILSQEEPNTNVLWAKPSEDNKSIELLAFSSGKWRSLIGSEGKSAYEEAAERGFVGSFEEWLETMKGPKGDTGDQGLPGEQGPQGEAGKGIVSITYSSETPTETLYIMTFSDDSTYALSIPKGQKGDPGKDGADGKDGEDGQDGTSFTYADLTAAQKAELAQPATEQAAIAAGHLATIQAALDGLDPSQSTEDAITALTAQLADTQADVDALGPKINQLAAVVGGIETEAQVDLTSGRSWVDERCIFSVGNASYEGQVGTSSVSSYIVIDVSDYVGKTLHYARRKIVAALSGNPTGIAFYSSATRSDTDVIIGAGEDGIYGASEAGYESSDIVIPSGAKCAAISAFKSRKDEFFAYVYATTTTDGLQKDVSDLKVATEDAAKRTTELNGVFLEYQNCNANKILFTSTDFGEGDVVNITLCNESEDGTHHSANTGIGFFNSSDTRISVPLSISSSNKVVQNSDVTIPSGFAYAKVLDWGAYNYIEILYIDGFAMARSNISKLQTTAETLATQITTANNNVNSNIALVNLIRNGRLCTPRWDSTKSFNDNGTIVARDTTFTSYALMAELAIDDIKSITLSADYQYECLTHPRRASSEAFTRVVGWQTGKYTIPSNIREGYDLIRIRVRNADGSAISDFNSLVANNGFEVEMADSQGADISGLQESVNLMKDGVLASAGYYRNEVLFDTSKVKEGDKVRLCITSANYSDPSGYVPNVAISFYNSSDTRITIAIQIDNATSVKEKSLDVVIPSGFAYARCEYNWATYTYVKQAILLTGTISGNGLLIADESTKTASLQTKMDSVLSTDYNIAETRKAFIRIANYNSGHNKIVFPIITDTHRMVSQVRWLCSTRLIGFDFIAHLGDIGVDTAYSSASTDKIGAAMSMLNNYADAQGQAQCPVLFTKGNHECYIDDAGYNLMILKEFVQMPSERKHPMIKSVDSRMYGYYDIESKSTRVLFLDSFDGGNALSGVGFSASQIGWVINTLTSTPNGWHIIILDHLFPDYRGNWRVNDGGTYRDPTASDFNIPSATALVTILKAYIARGSGSTTIESSTVSWDFSQASAYIVGMFCGHSHFDYEVVENGLNLVLSKSMGSASTTTEIPSWGRYNATSATTINVDVVCVDLDSKEFKIVRLGAGGESADREFDY